MHLAKLEHSYIANMIYYLVKIDAEVASVNFAGSVNISGFGLHTESSILFPSSASVTPDLSDAFFKRTMNYICFYCTDCATDWQGAE